MNPFALARSLAAGSAVSLALAPTALIWYRWPVCAGWAVVAVLTGLWATAESRRVRRSLRAARREKRGKDRLLHEVTGNVFLLPSVERLSDDWSRKVSP
jgi:uncharacterized iron-regulated membrane protein